MPYQNSWYSRIIEGTKETLKKTAETLETTIKWLMPFGIKKQFLDINIRHISYQTRQRNAVYCQIDGLEKKIQKLESNKDANATTYGLLRTMLTFPIIPFFTVAYHTSLVFEKPPNHEEHIGCYISAVIVAYIAGTIFGKIRKTQFESKAEEDLQLIIGNYRTPPKDDEENKYLSQKYAPPEYTMIPQDIEQQMPTKPKNKIKNFNEKKPETDYPLPKEINWEELEKAVNNYKLQS